MLPTCVMVACLSLLLPCQAKANSMTLNSLMQLKPGSRRSYHDDLTIQVCTAQSVARTVSVVVVMHVLHLYNFNAHTNLGSFQYNHALIENSSQEFAGPWWEPAHEYRSRTPMICTLWQIQWANYRYKRFAQ